MRWVLKAAAQRALSVAPKGRELQHLLQLKLTKSLPGDDAYFRLKARKAFQHFDVIRRHLPDAHGSLRLFEFGAGWDLIGPLIFYALGFDDQTVTDVAPLLALDLVAHAIRQYGALMDEMESTFATALRPLGVPSIRSFGELRERFGIAYTAPCDAASTGLQPGSVDFISSTSTLQHVPEQAIPRILEECRRLLRPGGVMSCHIDLQDGFAEFDRKLTQYNFLRFGDRAWGLLNAPFYFQNRLRAPDFVQMFQAAGFDVVERQVDPPTEKQLEQLREVPLAERFRRYPPEELAILRLAVVAVKR